MSDDDKNILNDLYKKIVQIENSMESVKHHPSQNGGWKQMMTLIEKIDKRLEELEESLNDPRTGAVVEVQTLREWRKRVDLILQEFQESCNRILRLEMQVSAYNKITWAVALGTVGLIVKAFMGLIMV